MEPDDWLDLVGERSREEAEMTLTLFPGHKKQVSHAKLILTPDLQHVLCTCSFICSSSIYTRTLDGQALH